MHPRTGLDPKETLDPAALQREQLRRLRSMLKPVLQGNAFYRRKLARAGLRAAADVTTMDAYRQLPFTTKRELTEDQAETPPYGTLLTYPAVRYVREHHTSGTTGRTLRWLDTAHAAAGTAACGGASRAGWTRW